MKLSVCMITYNHDNFIIEAINGVLMQKTSFDYELIIANDCSPDNSDEVIKKYLEDHPKKENVRYLKNEKNKGMQANFAFAIENCSGQYIAICEGDDYWTDPLKLQKQIDYMEMNPNISFSFHGAKTIDSKGNYGMHYKHPKFINQKTIPVKYFLEKAAAGFCTASVMIKREVVTDLPKWFLEAHIGDYPLMFLALEKGDIGYLEDIMCVYRLSVKEGWSSQNMTLKGRLKNFQKMVALNNVINNETKGKYKKYLKLNMSSYIWNKIIVAIQSLSYE